MAQDIYVESAASPSPPLATGGDDGGAWARHELESKLAQPPHVAAALVDKLGVRTPAHLSALAVRGEAGFKDSGAASVAGLSPLDTIGLIAALCAAREYSGVVESKAQKTDRNCGAPPGHAPPSPGLRHREASELVEMGDLERLAQAQNAAKLLVSCGFRDASEFNDGHLAHGDPPANVGLFDAKSKTLMVPVYSAVVVKSLRNIKETDETIDMVLTLVVRIQYGGLPGVLRRELAEKLQFRINEMPLQFDAGATDAKWKKSIYMITSRMDLKDLMFTAAALRSELKGKDEDPCMQWIAFPFDTPLVHLRIEMTSFTIDENTSVAPCLGKWKVRYNFHEFLDRPSVGAAGRMVKNMTPVFRRFSSEHDGDSGGTKVHAVNEQTDTPTTTPDDTEAGGQGRARTSSQLNLLSGMMSRQLSGLPGENNALLTADDVAREKLNRTRVMISFKKTCDNLPCFGILHSGVSVCFPPEVKRDSATGKLSQKYYPVAIFRIPIYRHPFHVIRTMVVPLVITNIGTILTLRMRVLPPPHSNFNDRVSCLVTVLLALFAFLAYARGSCPDVPISTWMDSVIFQSIMMTCIGLVDTTFAYETVSWLEPTGGYGTDDDDNDAVNASRRSLVSKGGSGGSDSTIATAAEYTEWFLPTGNANLSYENNSFRAVAHRSFRSLMFLIVVAMEIAIVVRLVSRLREYFTTRRRNDLLLATTKEVKRKSTDFDPATYGWPEANEFAEDALGLDTGLLGTVGDLVEYGKQTVKRASGSIDKSPKTGERKIFNRLETSSSVSYVTDSEAI